MYSIKKNEPIFEYRIGSKLVSEQILAWISALVGFLSQLLCCNFRTPGISIRKANFGSTTVFAQGLSEYNQL